jgi:hypothetical protein
MASIVHFISQTVPGAGQVRLTTPNAAGTPNMNDGPFGAIFNGSITTNTLTVNSVSQGALGIGQIVTGVGVAANTVITAGSGTTWTVSQSQTVGSEAMVSTIPTPSTDPVGLWWTDTGVIGTRTTSKQLLMALKDMIKFIERGGFRTSGAAGQDTDIPT